MCISTQVPSPAWYATTLLMPLTSDSNLCHEDYLLQQSVVDRQVAQPYHVPEARLAPVIDDEEGEEAEEHAVGIMGQQQAGPY
jgi:hypothetical protein